MSARRRRLAGAAWIALLAASHLWIATRPAPPPVPDGRHAAPVPAQDDRGPTGDRAPFSWLAFEPAAADPRPPVVLLHGSPGEAGHMARLGRALERRGRRALAPDLPGFGPGERAAPSYSILAHARAVLAWLDVLGVERAHWVGFSMGGGVALHAAELAPRRVASVTLLASIGAQEAEGSGSWAIEHAKYALLWSAMVAAPELVPHFGLLGPRSARNAFARNFWDSDQRPLRGLMESLETPTLILHGARDFLVPPWAAELHHELIGPSRLVLLDASHFVPFGEDEPGEPMGDALAQLAPFLARHDLPGVAEPRARIDLAPARPRHPLEPPGWPRSPYALHARVSGWALLALAALGSWALPRAGPALGAAVAGALLVDAVLVAGGCALGLWARSAARARRAEERPRPGELRRWLGPPLRVAGLFALAVVVAWPARAGGGLARAVGEPLAVALLAAALLGLQVALRRARRRARAPLHAERAPGASP